MRLIMFLALVFVGGCAFRQEMPSRVAAHDEVVAQPATGGGAIQPQPTRHEIVRVMSDPRLADELRACGLRGSVYVQVRFRGSDGAVFEAYPARYFREPNDEILRVAPEAADPPIAPSVWACAEVALKRLRTSPFAAPTFRVSFPVLIR